MLALKHLGKSYVAGKTVLSNINVEFAAHDISAIIGPSGTVKGTW